MMYIYIYSICIYSFISCCLYIIYSMYVSKTPSTLIVILTLYLFHSFSS